MASYKDPANLKFNPYVRTLPVEAMAKVGQYKQERYDQGVQKIQQSIDNIAGLEIAKSEDKEYLQSKLNALGSQLTNVAGGDFSNFALVNSVNGMTNQIAKDPGVINAVSNTAKYKKDIAAKEKLELEGKWAPSNEAAFQKDVNKWYSNPSIDAKYNANVSPYVNVQEDSQKIIKGLAQEVTPNEIMFDPLTGKYLDVMTKEVIKELTPEKILTALKAGLSPQAWRQLSIDGEYKYSNTTTDDYINQINSSYKKTFTFLNEKRSELSNLLKNVQTPAQKLQIEEQLTAQDARITANKREYDAVSKGFEEGDVASSQSQFYTIKWMENISQSFSSRDVDSNSKVSPYFTVQMQKDNKALALAKHNEQVKNNRIMQGLKREEVDLLDTPKTGDSFPIPGKEITPNSIVKNETIKRTDLLNLATSERKRVAELMGWDDQLRFVDVNNDRIYNPDQGDYIAEEKKGGLTEFDRLLTIAKNNRFATIAPSSIGDVQGYISAQRSSDSSLFKNKAISDVVDDQLPLVIVIPDEFKDKTFQGLTPKETVSLMQTMYSNYMDISPDFSPKGFSGISSSQGQNIFNDELAMKDLAERNPEAYKFYNNIIRGTSEEANVAKRMWNDVSEDINFQEGRRKKLHSELLVKASTVEQDVGIPLNLADKTVKNQFQSVLGTIELVANGGGGWPGLDSDTAKNIMAVKDNINDVSIITGVQELRVSGAGFNIPIPLTDEQYGILTKSFEIKVEKTPEVATFDRQYMSQLLSTNPSINQKDFFTTATPDEEGISSRNTTQENAYLQQTDFPSIQFLRNVSGNLITKENPKNNDPNIYLQINFDYLDPKLQRKDPITGNSEVPTKTSNFEIDFGGGRGLNKAEIVTFMNSLTDDALFRFYTGRDMTLEEKKLLQNQPLNIPQ
tara:strand:- start:269 stop:2983 length:2715 start_codon:yes stop_codon:yes gene_type:complete